jgi:glycosyltransferase involved in cell wall biosynthesis
VRILVVNWQDRENPQGGGAETHLHEIFGRIAARGHTVHLLCSGFKGAPSRATLDGIDVFRVGGRYTFQFVARRFYRKHLAGSGYDVVIEDMNKIPLFVPRWKPRRAVALVHHLFGTTAFREASAPVAAIVWLSERPIRWIYRDTPFEAVSDSTTQDLVSRGIPRQNVRVIYNGVDVEALTPNPAERSATPLFSYFGRLKKYKRVDIVIRAFAELDNPDARLEVAGSGDFRPSLEKLVASLGIQERVKFAGRITEEEKLSLLRRSWASVIASPKEGWGITNLETAACGTPVIAVDSPGIRESVVDGKTGFLVTSSPGAIAQRMRELIAQPGLVETLGRQGRKFAEGFTWERAADDTEADLEAIIRGSGR